MSSGIFTHVAQFSFPVFPVVIAPHPTIPGKFTKRPLTRRSHLDRKPGPQWTEAEWPAEANGIAFVPADRGWVCIDLDHGHDADWVFENLPGTRTHLTPSGSFHLFYECAESFGNRKLENCIDVRGGNGWVPLPEVSAGYSTIDARKPTSLPDPIRKRLIDASEPKERVAAPDGLIEADGDPLLIKEARDIIAAHIRLKGIGDDPRGERAYALANLLGDKRNGDNILSHDKIVELMQEAGYGEIAGDILERRKVGDRGHEQITFDPPDPDGDFAEKFARFSEPDKFTGEWWSTIEVEPRRQIIGPIDADARVLMTGGTGAGKTMFGLALAAAAASGTPLFACGRWSAPEPRRVLVIDGEMSARQLKERVGETLRGRETGDRFVLLSMAAHFHTVPALNRGGFAWLRDMIELYRPDLILFDNVQALVAGDMKETDGWRELMPHQLDLTRRGIAQVWFHHLNSAGEMYGDKTREWQMDLGIKLAKVDGQGLCIDLGFTKVRERETAEHCPGRVKFEGGLWRFTPAGQVLLDEVEEALAFAGCELTKAELATRLGVTQPALMKRRGIERFIIDRSHPVKFGLPL